MVNCTSTDKHASHTALIDVNSTVVWHQFFTTTYAGWTCQAMSRSPCGLWFTCDVAPQYLTELCISDEDIEGRRQLRSASRGLLYIPRYELRTYS